MGRGTRRTISGRTAAPLPKPPEPLQQKLFGEIYGRVTPEMAANADDDDDEEELRNLGA